MSANSSVTTPTPCHNCNPVTNTNVNETIADENVPNENVPNENLNETANTNNIENTNACDETLLYPPDNHPIQLELDAAEECIPGFSNRFTVIDKIGEGTLDSIIIITY